MPGFVNKNLVMEYPHERAVADGVNVQFFVYKIRTKISEQGSAPVDGLASDTHLRVRTRSVTSGSGSMRTSPI